MSDLEWDSWLSEWKQSPNDRVTDGLSKLALRGVRRQVAGLIAEIVASGLVLLFYGYVLATKPSPPLIALALASSVFVGAWLTYLLAVRGGTWKSSGTSGAAYMVLLIARMRSQLRWHRFVRGCLVAMAGFGLLWAPWQLMTFGRQYALEPWRGCVGFGGYFGVLVVLWFWNRKRTVRASAELEQLEDLSRELGSDVTS